MSLTIPARVNARAEVLAITNTTATFNVKATKPFTISMKAKSEVINLSYGKLDASKYKHAIPINTKQSGAI